VCGAKSISVCIADHEYDLESRDGGGGASPAGQPGSVEGHLQNHRGLCAVERDEARSWHGASGNEKGRDGGFVQKVFLFFCLYHNPNAETLGGDSGPESPTL